MHVILLQSTVITASIKVKLEENQINQTIVNNRKQILKLCTVCKSTESFQIKIGNIKGIPTNSKWDEENVVDLKEPFCTLTNVRSTPILVCLVKT